MAYVVYEISLAKKRFATQLITKSVSQTESELDNFFERVGDLVQAVEQQYTTLLWAGSPLEKTVLHAASLIENYAPVSSIGVADLRGYELNIIPDTVKGQWLTRRVFVDRWGFVEKWARWQLGEGLKLTERWQKPLAVDPRERPWFKGALQAKGIVYWTHPYEYTTGPHIGITASTWLRVPGSSADSLSKILAFDLTLNDLNGFIEELHLSENQNIFLLTGDNSKVIALNNYSSEFTLEQIQSALLLSPDKLGSATLLRVLAEESNQEAFSFESYGETWWGILRPYKISDTRKINIVSVLPESDFALGITRTLWVSIGSFLLILALSVVLVSNHNKLHRVGEVLSEKNKLISEQKKILFSEVHHRVKNNLALISAFLQLELMNEADATTSHYLQRNLHRIKIIAIVQEEAYKSDRLGLLSAESLLNSIIAFAQKKAPGKKCTVSASKDLHVNVNQALTYGLLMYELIREPLTHKSSETSGVVSINAFQEDSNVITHIQFGTDLPAKESASLGVPDSNLIRAFSAQLGADLRVSRVGGPRRFELQFKQKAQKGAVGNKHYKPSG
jgi:two-component sensor histidine kinase